MTHTLLWSLETVTVHVMHVFLYCRQWTILFVGCKPTSKVHWKHFVAQHFPGSHHCHCWLRPKMSFRVPTSTRKTIWIKQKNIILIGNGLGIYNIHQHSVCTQSKKKQWVNHLEIFHFLWQIICYKTWNNVISIAPKIQNCLEFYVGKSVGTLEPYHMPNFLIQNCSVIFFILNTLEQ